MTTLKALSVKQPHAGLIMAGLKPIENRSWSISYTGTLAICSTLKPEPPDVFNRMRKLCKRLKLPFPESLCAINGSYLGTVEKIASIWLDRRGKITSDHPELIPPNYESWWNDDLIGWVLSDPKPATPKAVKGKLGLWTLEL